MYSVNSCCQLLTLLMNATDTTDCKPVDDGNLSSVLIISVGEYKIVHLCITLQSKLRSPECTI